MKPTPQLRKGPQGDCFRACIASLLELPIEDVPDFAEITERLMMPDHASFDMVQRWFTERHMAFLEIPLPAQMPWIGVRDPVFCILFGDTEAGIKHAIVGSLEGDKFVPVFNPWPEAQITGVTSVGLIVPQDPSVLVGREREWLGVVQL